MRIQLPTHAGTREYEPGSLTARQVMAVRALTLEHPGAIFHAHADRELRSGEPGAWTVAWTGRDGRVRATTINPDGSGRTSEPTPAAQITSD